MKHPRDKQGNDVFCDLPLEATTIIEAMPRQPPGPAQWTFWYGTSQTDQDSK
jgi:hypothetical protein